MRPSPELNPHDHRLSIEDTPTKGRGRKISSFLIGGTIVTGSVLGLSGCGDNEVLAVPEPGGVVATAPNDETTEPTATDTASVEATPTPTASDLPTTPTPTGIDTTVSPSETDKTREQLVEELSIEVGLSDEEYAKQYMDAVFSQALAGTSEELWEETFNNFSEGFGSEDIQERLAEVAEEQGDIYADALYHPDWRTIQSLHDTSERMREGNRQSLYLWGANHNIEGYPDFKNWYELDSVELVEQDTSGARRMSITATEYNNYDEISDDFLGAGANNGETFVIQIATSIDVENGKERVAWIGSPRD